MSVPSSSVPSSPVQSSPSPVQALTRRDSIKRVTRRMTVSLARASTSLNRASTSLHRAFTATARATRRLSLPTLNVDTAPTSFYEAEFPSPHCFSAEALAVTTEELEEEEQAWGSPTTPFPWTPFGWSKKPSDQD